MFDWKTEEESKLAELFQYCAKDSNQTIAIFDHFFTDLTPEQTYLYNQLRELYEIGLEMEETGLDWDFWAAIGHLQRLRREAFRSLYAIKRMAEAMGYSHRGSKAPKAGAPPRFNPGSVQQLARIFCGPIQDEGKPMQFGLAPLSYTDGGIPRIDKEALEHYEATAGGALSTFAHEVLRYRKAKKQLGTYVIGLYEKLRPDGKLHVNWMFWVPVTGRCSSSPNAQNISAKHEPTKGIISLRDLIRAPTGWKIVGADMSALEGRISAQLAGQLDLVEAFNKDFDVHLDNARQMFKDPKLPKKNPDGTPNQKREALKTTYYAWIYGAMDETIWKQLILRFPDITMAETAAMTKWLCKKYPAYPKWWKTQVKLAETTDAATCPLSGRKYKFYGSVDRNNAINNPVQMMAAEMMNRALRGVRRELPPDWRIIVQCHDEILLLVPDREEDIAKAKALLVKHMTHKFTINGITSDYSAEPKAGVNWLETH